MANSLFRKIFRTIGDVENKMNQVLFLVILFTRFIIFYTTGSGIKCT